MRSQAARWSLALTLMACSPVLAGEHACWAPGQPHSIGQPGPAGGWDPYGGGLLHWWNPHGFPRCGGPDDYCRKPLPRVCSPPYPPFYTFGPPELAYPHHHACRHCNQPH